MSDIQFGSGKIEPPIQARILWFALFASQILFLFVLDQSLGNSNETQSLGVQKVDSTLFFFLGASIWVFAYFGISAFFTKIGTQGVSSGGLEKREERRQQSVFVFSVVRWAAFESVTLIGFVHAFTQKQFQLIFPFLAAGLLGMVLTFPSRFYFQKHMGRIKV